MKTKEIRCFYCGSTITCCHFDEGDVGKKIEVKGKVYRVYKKNIGWQPAWCPSCKERLNSQEVALRVKGKIHGYMVDLNLMPTSSMEHYLEALYTENEEARRVINRLTREVS